MWTIKDIRGNWSASSYYAIPGHEDKRLHFETMKVHSGAIVTVARGEHRVPDAWIWSSDTDYKEQLSTHTSPAYKSTVQSIHAHADAQSNLVIARAIKHYTGA